MPNPLRGVALLLGEKPNAFTDSLKQLQALHEREICTLVGEITRLHEELGRSRCSTQWAGSVPDVRHSYLTGSEGAVRSESTWRVAMLSDVEPAQASVDTVWRVASVRSDAEAGANSEPMWKLTSLHSSGEPPLEGDESMWKLASLRANRAPSAESGVMESIQSEQANRSRSDQCFGSEKGNKLLKKYTTIMMEKRQQSKWKTWCLRLITAPAFDFAMGAIIVANAVTIGLESSIGRHHAQVPLVLTILENVFLACYTIELCMRFGAFGKRTLCNPWVQFDALLVACGWADVIVKVTPNGPSFTLLDNMVLVRTFRLARLARVLRLMSNFQTLWMLVQGLLNSLVTLAWTCMLICILLFVFAVLGLELLQPDPSASDEYNEVAEENFGSLYRAMATLLQGLTLDSFGAIYRPVLLARPVTVFYFVPFILIVSIALMNLVTAHMVNISLDQAGKDKQYQEQMAQEQKEEMVQTLRAAFRELDQNKSGRIDLDEMKQAPPDLRDLIFNIADLKEHKDSDMQWIFATLDFDHSGYLEIHEFCDGILKLHDRKALESAFIMKQCEHIVTMLRGLEPPNAAAS